MNPEIEEEYRISKIDFDYMQVRILEKISDLMQLELKKNIFICNACLHYKIRH